MVYVDVVPLSRRLADMERTGVSIWMPLAAVVDALQRRAAASFHHFHRCKCPPPPPWKIVRGESILNYSSRYILAICAEECCKHLYTCIYLLFFSFLYIYYMSLSRFLSHSVRAPPSIARDCCVSSSFVAEMDSSKVKKKKFRRVVSFFIFIHCIKDRVLKAAEGI